MAHFVAIMRSSGSCGVVTPRAGSAVPRSFSTPHDRTIGFGANEELSTRLKQVDAVEWPSSTARTSPPSTGTWRITLRECPCWFSMRARSGRCGCGGDPWKRAIKCARAKRESNIAFRSAWLARLEKPLRIMRSSVTTELSQMCLTTRIWSIPQSSSPHDPELRMIANRCHTSCSELPC